ncbi:molybdate transport system regulatory protein [Persephonella hydrogeniphila]|uniref:Molybdate transport system regulatory protein n=1 Tax=Persephonella hydrogeniphila TaxID=198703 RepID=A0A285N577_9AQUI|nr:LysR family transcriptional regulator [Persephonella hydrogeniphila]SNZ03997.1 molybdate transport system regulatory protein [Persephonella hydrogeniphila]
MRYKIKFKVWLEKDKDIIMGLGRDKLLREIDKQGSISKAAKEVGMSYKKAWSFIKTMEKRLGIKLIETKRGGKGGGGAYLTDDAKRLLKDFEKITDAFERLTRELSKDE